MRSKQKYSEYKASAVPFRSCAQYFYQYVICRYCDYSPVREDVLLLQGVDYSVLEKVTGECASRVYNALMHQRLEPGTKEAFNAYVACLHQLYLFGAAMQLKRMGYHMTKMN